MHNHSTIPVIRLIYSNQNFNYLISTKQHTNLLTISDFNNFASIGGMIELRKSSSGVNIYINMTTIKNSNLKIDYDLLNYARIVE